MEAFLQENDEQAGARYGKSVFTGTAGYLAPEQLYGKVTQIADI